MGKKNKLQNSTLHIKGMHCASCEVLIEKKILKKEGIELADASLKNSTLKLAHKKGARPNISELNKEFEDLGYEFSTNQFKKEEKTFNDKVNEIGSIIIIVGGLIMTFFIFEYLQLGQYISVDASSSLPAFFLLGLVAGLSSCAALVGGLLLSMIKQWNEVYIDSDSKTEKAKPHVLFHAGRMLAFTILGGTLGLIGESISLNNATFFSILTVLVSVIMLMLALQMLNVRWAQRFRFTAPKFITRFAANEENFQGKQIPFITGALTFFLPCGFTLIAQTVALTAGSFMQGAFVMLFFALGTLPTLAGISWSGLAMNKKPHLTAQFNLIAGLVIIFFVVYNINGQLNVLGLPSLSDINLQSGSSSEVSVALDESGKQTLTFIAEGFEYIPTSETILKAGQPAKLVVDNQGIQGCGAFIAARGLFSSYVALEPGINEIDLGSPKKGTYKLTCSMGMVPPVTIKVI